MMGRVILSLQNAEDSVLGKHFRVQRQTGAVFNVFASDVAYLAKLHFCDIFRSPGTIGQRR